MRKLVSLLLALCMMYGAWTAVAEEGTTELQIGGFLLQVPAWAGTYYGTDDLGNVKVAYFDDHRVIAETFQKELPSRVQYEYLRPGNWTISEPMTRAEAAYFGGTSEGYFIYKDNVDIGLYNGEPVCVAIWVDEYSGLYVLDISLFDNNALLTIRSEFSAESNFKATEKRWVDYLVNKYSTILLTARPHTMTEEEMAAKEAEAAAKEAALAEAVSNILNGEKKEVKIGSVTFKIPAGLTETRITEMDGHFQSDVCSLSLVSWTINDDIIQASVKESKENGLPITSQQATILMGETVSGYTDPNLAVVIALNAVEEDIGMLNGEQVMTMKDFIVFCSQTYQGVYYSVTVDGEVLMMEEKERIAKDIMLSVKIDGVTEEDMIADSQADYVVITADSGKIRTEPSISGGLIKTAYKGETYELIEQSGAWYVIDVDGRTGYLHSGVAEIQ